MTAVITRFIPTHVGNAAPALNFGASSPVHPHARGERPLPRNLQTLALGSSPRTWGTLRVGQPGGLVVRFIPTHVGNALETKPEVTSLTVHPHARGERTCPIVFLRPEFGSSPRTWGTHSPACCSESKRRFIPTHVGNAIEPKNVDKVNAVHPHARGERPRKPGRSR